ncbi:MAG: hypothetical protein WCB12_24515 [Bryobacteraceae bacterium]
MSIAILIAVHDGLVIAADSASTLSVSVVPGTVAGVAKVYDNANKIFNLYKGRPIGIVTFGSGSIGNASIGTLMKDLRAVLMDGEKAKQFDFEFDPDNYTMRGVAEIVAKFLGAECEKQPAATLLGMNIGFLLGGYSTTGGITGRFGESWGIEIKAGKPTPPSELRPSDQAGISWGGAPEVVQRIVIGFSPLLFQILAEVSASQGQQEPVSPEQLFKQLNPILVARLQAPIVFPPMPIQDAIDLAEFLVHASIMYSRFLPGPQIIGGPIEIAAVTKHEGFKWIRRKHYYDQTLNREPLHVIVDRSEED